MTGAIYSAPDLIFHYVRTHHYRPPDGFLRALLEAPRPPDPAYFARLEQEGLEWQEKGDALPEPSLSSSFGKESKLPPVHLDLE